MNNQTYHLPSDSPESAILKCAENWLSSHPHILLFTVVNTWGTSPRPAGSIMVMNPTGEITGSVSGGCIEEELIKRRDEFFTLSKPTIVDYGIKTDLAAKVSLPCGGGIELVIEKLNDINHISTILDYTQKDLMVYRQLDMNTGDVTLYETDGDGYDFQYHEQTICKRFGKAWQIIIVGANQISFYLAKIAEMLDYQILIIEPRKEYIQSWQYSEFTLDTQYPDEALARISVNANTAIITLAHDPQLDDRTLIEALGSHAFYLGALGSKKTHMLRKKRLARYGITEKELSQLHAPIGLPIGSKAPPEIAISILAEITAQRHKVRSFLAPMHQTEANL